MRHIGALVVGLLAWPVLAWAQMPAPMASGESLGTPELLQQACAEGQVVYYTPDSEAQTRALTAGFAREFPCVKVLTVSAVSGRLIERVSSEVAAGKMQADAILINDLQALTTYKDKHIIRPWTPPVADKFPPNAKNEGWWYGAGGTTDYIIYNTDLVSEADAPKTWQDLLDPKWKGKIAAGQVSLGGTAWMQYYFFQQKYGDDFIAKFGQQKPKWFTALQPLTLAVARGELAIGLSCVSVEAPMRVGDGAPIKAVYPADGLPNVPSFMALMNNGPHPHAAELFANWMVSREGQDSQVRERKIWSQRPDIKPAAGNPDVSTINIWSIPAEEMVREYVGFGAKATHLLGQD